MSLSDAFDTYQNLTGSTLDATTGLLRLNPDQVSNLQSLFFHIGDVRLPPPLTTIISCQD